MQKTIFAIGAISFVQAAELDAAADAELELASEVDRYNQGF